MCSISADRIEMINSHEKHFRFEFGYQIYQQNKTVHLSQCIFFVDLMR